MCEGGLLLVCPYDVVGLWGLPLMLQELGVPEDLGPVVLLHDEGPVGAVLAGSLLPDGALDVPTFSEDILHDASVPNLKAVWARLFLRAISACLSLRLVMSL